MDESASKMHDDLTSVPTEVEASKKQEKGFLKKEAKIKEEQMESDISDEISLSKKQESTTENIPTGDEAPLNTLGELKIRVAQQLTTKDCQTIATLEEFKPAEREQMTDGVILMNALESKNVYDKNNLQRLQKLFHCCELHKAADIIKHYMTVTVKDDIPTPDPVPSTSIPIPTSIPNGYRQFRVKLESLLTEEHAHKLATSFGYPADKIEDISKSETPSRLLVQLMDESGEISPTDISKLITALEKDPGLKDKVEETFELYGKFYEKFLHTLESKLTRKDAVSLAENFGYPVEKIDNIRKSETPSQVFVQLMCEENDISPMNNSKLQSSLKQVFDYMQLVTEVEEAFDLQRKTSQFVKELRGKYKNLCGGILPVPFLREKYDIDNVFVESGIQFRIEKQGNDKEKEKWNELENHKMIFTDPNVKSHRRIIDGEPGYGKSTLALQITHDWCQRKAPMKDFPILILLRLSQFRNVSNVYAAIKNFLLPKDSKLDGDDIKNILDSSSAVYILDGYDEYPGRGNEESHIECIIKGDMFQEQEVVVLTRTSCLPYDTTRDIKRIKLTGFNKDVRFEYIRKVVSGHDSVKAKEIKQLIEKSPVADDFCTVPMFCVMICHMAKENKTFKDLDTVTKLFKRVIACFHSHEKIRKNRKAKLDHGNLDKIAFEALKGTSQEITWDKDELSRDIGEDLYDEYTRIGILREEEVFDDDESDYKTETKFFHKLFAEWYAAHYLVNEISQSRSRIGSEPRQNANEKAEGTSQHHHANRETVDLLNNLDPWEFHYMYQFACGLSSDVALEIIKYLGTNFMWDKYTILCIAEWMEQWSGRFDTIEDTVTALCSRGLEIRGGDSLRAQKCTVELIKQASKRKIPIHFLFIIFIPDKDDAGNLILKPSNLALPVLDTDSRLRLHQGDQMITEEQIENILRYLVKCQGSIELEFFGSLLPRYITVTESMSALTSRDVEIIWDLLGSEEDFRLNFNSGHWENFSYGLPITDEEYQREEEKFHSFFMKGESYRKREESYRKKEESYRKKEESYRKKEESYRKKEESFRKKEESYRKKEESFRKKEESYRKKEESFRKKVESYRKKEESFRKVQESLKEEQESFQEEQESFQKEQESFQGEKESFLGEKESFQGEQESFQGEKESVLGAQESLQEVMESLRKAQVSLQEAYSQEQESYRKEQESFQEEQEYLRKQRESYLKAYLQQRESYVKRLEFFRSVVKET